MTRPRDIPADERARALRLYQEACRQRDRRSTVPIEFNAETEARKRWAGLEE